MTRSLLVFGFAVLLPSMSYAFIQTHERVEAIASRDDVAPPCLSGTTSSATDLPVDNDSVIHLKTATQNQHLARAHIFGKVGKIYPDRNGHIHFELKIAGTNKIDDIEVVYNTSFGKLPPLRRDQQVEACGDFINSFEDTQQYEKSEDGAIIHWVHYSPRPKKHASGYLMIEGQLYGNNGHY